MKKLKMYSAGTCLENQYLIVFAHNLREAKKIAWPVMQDYGAEEYTEMRVWLAKGMSWLWKEKKSDGTHYIEPKICNTCEMWGQSEIIDGLCEDCRKESDLDDGFVCPEDEYGDDDDENYYYESEIDPETGAHG